MKNIFLLALTLGLTAPLTCFSAGMKPDTPTLFIDANNREAVVTVQNTDNTTALLHSSVQSIPEDKTISLLITPQLARLEPGQKQLVRVILKNDVNITHQRMQRLNFTSVPKKHAGKDSKAQLVIAQNIPVIISPVGLPVNYEPWKELIFLKTANGIKIENNSKYIVRMLSTVTLLPAGKAVDIKKRYILPGEKIDIPLKENELKSVSRLKIQPATRFGMLAAPYIIDI
ncbi:fimbria/pilus chaperone family protein [Hafnia psychrotolerans]|nr:fimbria/pilus chaperone family protein [Hafnia psychrotolerans]